MWQYLYELEQGKYESIEDRTLLQWKKGQAKTSAKNKAPLKNYSHTSEDIKPIHWKNVNWWFLLLYWGKIIINDVENKL